METPTNHYVYSPLRSDKGLSIMTMLKIHRRRLQLLLVAVITIILLSTLYYHRMTAAVKFKTFSRTYDNWTNYANKPTKSKEWYESVCFSSRFTPNIGSLQHNIDILSMAQHEECQLIYQVFRQIFTLDVRSGSLTIPDPFVDKVMGWLGNNKELFESIKHQNITHIYNEYSGEHTVYNPLRGKRPVSKPDVDPKDYVNNIDKATKDSCDFCKYKELTAADVFGRLESEYAVTASNTFKLDSWHGLMITKSHHPIQFTEPQILDIFNLSKQWFEKVHSQDKECQYPQLLWDTMPHAGASQVHPHIHTILSPKRYYGMFEIQRRGAQRYYEDTQGRNYFSDLVEVHQALGLAASLGNASAISYLNGRKDHEIVILSQTPDKDFFRLLYYTIEAYFEELGMYCFSSGMAYPIMGSDGWKGQMPAMIRISTRGDVSIIRSDISSIEIYMMANVNVDPYTVIEALRKSIARHTAS